MKVKHSLPKRRTLLSLQNKTARLKDTTSLELETLDQGFCPFARISVGNSPVNTTKDLTFFRMDDSQDISRSEVSFMLQQNKLKLSLINKKVSDKRRAEYDNYVSDNAKYCKLLELNNIRSRVMTTLKSNVGQIVVKAMQDHKPQDYQYVAELSRIVSTGWKPQSREGQSCTVYKDSIYLIGGHNSNPLGDICIFNFKEGTWSKMDQIDIKRSYHTTVAYKEHYFIVFGGMSGYNSYYKSRDCLNSTMLFSPLTNKAKFIKVANQHILEPRRSHSACLVGKQMLVFGGINMFKSYLKDLVYLDFKQLKWIELEYHTQSSQLEEFLTHGIAKHVMVENFRSYQGFNKLHNKDYQPEEGVFVFGGANQIGTRSVVMQISFKRRFPRIQKLQPSGFLPSAISPIASKVNSNVIAVISGERTERQMKLYKIKENEFVGINYRNMSPQFGGIGSSIVNYNNQMYVLFGVGEKGYIGTIHSMKIDQKLKLNPQKDPRKRRSFIHKSVKIQPISTHLQTTQ